MFAGISKAEQDARAITREAAKDASNFAQVATIRDHVRLYRDTKSARNLTDDEARGYGFAAMAALGREQDGVDYRRQPRMVGPYVGDAVRHVLRDVDATEADRNAVNSYATLFNVVARIN